MKILSSGKLIAFAATTSPAVAKLFYSETLGLSFVEESPFALVYEVNGTMLRVQKVDRLAPSGYTTLGWEVEDIRSMMKRLTEKGVHVEKYPGLDQDDDGIWTTPDGAYVAWFKDPDGNVLSLTQFAGVRRSRKKRKRSVIGKKRRK